ncbi:MAG: Rap1a/Tai family immunity protein [Thiobacillus sp.]
MRSSLLSRRLPAVLGTAAALAFGVPAHANEIHAKNGSVILRMCKSADAVKALSVMCHSYLDGYLDAARHFEKGRVAFCLSEDDRKRAAAAVVEWIEAHPQSLDQPAAEVLQRALATRFPCTARK